MKLAVIGLGVQGRKRRAIAGGMVAATIDPVAPGADFRSIEEVGLTDYDAACVCVPDEAKPAILRYLLAHGKHLLVEKPLLASAVEIHELMELARVNRAACYTAYNHRFEPHIERLKAILGEGTLGSIYLARFFYGNGTARDVRNSPWRDKDAGVISDLGSHLLDMALFLFGRRQDAGHVWSVNRFENVAPDHVLFGYAGKPLLEMEATLLAWRNTFGLDIFGELGSAHVNCLCKWGPSTLTVRKRVFPSGRPEETVETLTMADPTWKREFEHFVGLCATGGTNLENDLYLRDKLAGLSSAICPS